MKKIVKGTAMMIIVMCLSLRAAVLSEEAVVGVVEVGSGSELGVKDGESIVGLVSGSEREREGGRTLYNTMRVCVAK